MDDDRLFRSHGEKMPDSGHFHRVVVGLVGLFIAVLWGFLFYDLLLMRENLLGEAERHTRELAKAIEEHAERTIESVDLTLTATVADIAEIGRDDPARLRDSLRRRIEGRPQLGSLIAIGTDGRPFGNTKAMDGRPAIDLSDRDYVLAHQSAPSGGLYVGTPVQCRLDNEWFIPMSRPLAGVGGTYTGVLAAAVHPEYFQRFYAEMDLGAHGVTGLVRTDGTILVRQPDQGTRGRSVAGTPFFAAHMALRPQGTTKVAFKLDGRTRIASWKGIANYPVIAFVAMDVEDQLAPWRRQVMAYSAGASVATLVLVGLAILLLREFRRRETTAARLRAVDQHLHGIIDNSSAIIHVKDARGHFLMVNRRFEDLTGRPESEVRGLTDFAIHPATVALALEAHDRAVLASGQPETFEEHVVLPSGRRDFLAVKFPLVDAAGRPWAVCAIATDITENKLFAEKLRREHDFNQAALDSLPGIFYVLNRHASFLVWNRTLEQVTGYSGEEVTRLDPLDLFGGDDRDRVAASIGTVFADGEAVVEAVLVARDGTRTPFLLTGRRIPIDGQLCLAGMGIDISARVRAEAQVAEKTEALEQSNAELEQFAYVASHDLQEPLRMVTSYLQLLERHLGATLDDDAKMFMGFAVDGARRMQTLIRDLLEYSRVGRRGQTPVPVDTAEVVGAAIDNLRPAIDDARAVVEVTGGLPVVTGYAAELMRLFQNLIGNAVKYRARNRPPQVTISAHRDGRAWVFAIQDNGIGIDPSQFDRVFLIFQRLHAREAYEGTGIGLAVAKKIVDRHGGRLWLDSVPGQGSTFHFTLPVRPPSA